jgi:hypothetical protein
MMTCSCAMTIKDDEYIMILRNSTVTGPDIDKISLNGKNSIQTKLISLVFCTSA